MVSFQLSYRFNQGILNNIRWFRKNAFGTDKCFGAVLHCGSEVRRWDDLIAIPIAKFWRQ